MPGSPPIDSCGTKKIGRLPVELVEFYNKHLKALADLKKELTERDQEIQEFIQKNQITQQLTDMHNAYNGLALRYIKDGAMAEPMRVEFWVRVGKALNLNMEDGLYYLDDDLMDLYERKKR